MSSHMVTTLVPYVIKLDMEVLISISPVLFTEHDTLPLLTCWGVPGAAAIETLAPRVTIQGQGLPRGHTQAGLGDHAGAL